MRAGLRAFFFGNRLFGRWPAAARREFVFARTLLGDAHRRIQPSGEKGIHDLPRWLARVAAGYIGNDGIGNLRVTDRVFTFP